MKLERRYLTHEFRVSQDATPFISGYAAVFDTASNDIGWTEEIAPDAFNTVLATNPDTRALFNHHVDHVLGRTTSGTLKLSVDERGLAYTVTPPDTTFARDLIVSMRRGDINQSSFGFICKRDQWTDNPDGTVTRRILEIGELLDVSVVTYPAYDDALAGVRSLPGSMPAELRSRFERRALTDQCTCVCAQCMAGSCGICSAEPRCMGAERNSERSADPPADNWQADAMLRLRLAEAQ